MGGTLKPGMAMPSAAFNAIQSAPQLPQSGGASTGPAMGLPSGGFNMPIFGGSTQGMDWRSLLGGIGPMFGPMPFMPMPGGFQQMPGMQAQAASAALPPLPGLQLPAPPPAAPAPSGQMVMGTQGLGDASNTAMVYPGGA
jgi:hypothetical protein